MLLYRFQCAGFELFLIDQARGFFIADQFEGVLDLQLAAFLLAFTHVGEKALQLIGHLLHAWGSHDLDTGWALGHFDIDFLVVELALTQTLAEQLARIGISALHRLLLIEAGRASLR